MKKIKTNFLKKPYFYSIILAIILIVAGFSIFKGSGDDFELLQIKRDTLKRQVSVSGKVVASESAELGFEQGGRISNISTPVGTLVKKGEVIASIENGDIYAEIAQKQAAIEKENAKLSSLSIGTRPEQLAIDKQELIDTSTKLITILAAEYLNTENTVNNDIDTLFDDGNSINPTLSGLSVSSQREKTIENDRVKVTENLKLWKETQLTIEASLDQKKLEEALVINRGIFEVLNKFTDDLVEITDDLRTGSTFTQAEIDAHRNSINSAEQSIANSIKNIQDAEAEWINARNTLTLSEAGSTESDIASQNASVKISQADLLGAQARLTKTLIRAPFDGVITRMDIKVGEIVSPNTSKVSIMSASSYEIESFVPEVHIAYIKSGNPVTITLDAYGTDAIFDATVTTIDPAETIRDGVSTYKIKMSFDKSDERIRSGMTANAVITTLEKMNVIIVPQNTISTVGEKKTINKLVDGKAIETSVETGDSTSLGQVEIIKGLSEGDYIILNKTKN